jgi:hypothetical protein
MQTALMERVYDLAAEIPAIQRKQPWLVRNTPKPLREKLYHRTIQKV